MKKMTRVEVWQDMQNKKLKLYKKNQNKKIKQQIKLKKRNQKRKEKLRKKRLKRINSRIDKTVSALAVLVFGSFVLADVLAEKKELQRESEKEQSDE